MENEISRHLFAQADTTAVDQGPRSALTNPEPSNTAHAVPNHVIATESAGRAGTRPQLENATTWERYLSEGPNILPDTMRATQGSRDRLDQPGAAVTGLASSLSYGSNESGFVSSLSYAGALIVRNQSPCRRNPLNVKLKSGVCASHQTEVRVSRTPNFMVWNTRDSRLSRPRYLTPTPVSNVGELDVYSYAR